MVFVQRQRRLRVRLIEPAPVRHKHSLPRARAVDVRGIGFEADIFCVVVNGVLVLLETFVGVAAKMEAVGVAGFEANGIGVVGDGLVVLFESSVRLAALEEGFGVIGLEADSLGEVGDGFVVLVKTETTVNVAAIFEGVSVVGFGPDCLRIFRDRLLVIAFLRCCVAPLESSRGQRIIG
jgi:hypothetical protein